MDELDGRILRALRQDGRISITDLAAKVGLSATPVARRVRQLEEDGVITGYSAEIDEAKVGSGFSVFVSVKLDRQIDEALATFEKAIGEFPEVVDCWLMTGNRDYLMRVATADLVAFERFLINRLTRVPCVASIESSIPLRRVKSGQSLPA
ncbi:Lrp/AsnC family transcriptional regulator [Seohaeicola zhoushanensis]|uniref:ArsR family transcriptional regulator n=1 Tax=Seohaeicola zhoushanensis TaxID=1569283 RepID=A0A8J3GWU6_9RHOB|nr:Lrp/AsnC family transcriptional regulator [Seohaeicola zhoushanensis]GHF45559.1 ArsR family transcriptional regulator [Seohaeicola zhoushanensis]